MELWADAFHNKKTPLLVGDPSNGLNEVIGAGYYPATIVLNARTMRVVSRGSVEGAANFISERMR